MRERAHIVRANERANQRGEECQMTTRKRTTRKAKPAASAAPATIPATTKKMIGKVRAGSHAKKSRSSAATMPGLSPLPGGGLRYTRDFTAGEVEQRLMGWHSGSNSTKAKTLPATKPSRPRRKAAKKMGVKLSGANQNQTQPQAAAT